MLCFWRLVLLLTQGRRQVSGLQIRRLRLLRLRPLRLILVRPPLVRQLRRVCYQGRPAQQKVQSQPARLCRFVRLKLFAWRRGLVGQIWVVRLSVVLLVVRMCRLPWPILGILSFGHSWILLGSEAGGRVLMAFRLLTAPASKEHRRLRSWLRLKLLWR